uniref:MRP-like transporter n=1 Tax=Ganoderma boninense TaxID=34458 RepID=A0A5K1K0U2_9APHY|nr:MRP-like transporter [Ganoderma boninense]
MLQFKRTTPGSVSTLIFLKSPPNPNRVLDPTHPALHFKPVQYAKAFPWRSYPGFSIRALPKSLLDKPSYPAPNPPFVLTPPRTVTLDKGAARGGGKAAGDETEVGAGQGAEGVGEGSTQRWVEEKGRISMSLVNAATLGVGGRPVRVKVYNKFKNAIALVATRGADVERGPDGSKRIVFHDDEAGQNWVLRDWTYICRPHPTMNLMPYTELIPAVRRALKSIYVPGQRLEQEWGAPRALQVVRLLSSLGPVGEDVPFRDSKRKIEGRKVRVGKVLGELAKEGLSEPELAAFPPGDALLEGLLERYKALVTEIRTEGVAEAERVTRSSESPSASAFPQHETSGMPFDGRDFANEQKQHRDLNVMSTLPGREMIKARLRSQAEKHGSNVPARNPRSPADR